MIKSNVDFNDALSLFDIFLTIFYFSKAILKSQKIESEIWH